MAGAVKSSAQLLNIRRLFIPDPGYVICDVDLSGADAQVVAWEADDEDLKEAFKKGLKIHHKNAHDMWGPNYTDLPPDGHRKKQLYDQIKKGVHGVNYLESARTVAITLGWPVAEAEAFKKRWFRLHPGIPKWHERIQQQLERNRCVTNIFGFRKPYLERITEVLPKAVAWGPQSTVANVCFRGAIQVRHRLPWVQILLQVHDSLVFQIPIRRIRDLLLVRSALRVAAPYPDPLVIPWSISISPKSWGACEEMKWEEAVDLKV